MNEGGLPFRVGVVVLAAFLVTGILTLLFGGTPALGRKQYTLFIKFPEAPGVTVDTPVRKSGVLIGRAHNVGLKEDGVLVTVHIDSKHKIRQNEICRISTGSLLGDAVLEFILSGVPGASKKPLTGGDYINGVVASDPLRVLVNLESNMVVAIQSIQGAGDEVQLLAKNLNQVVGDDQGQWQRIMKKAESSLERFEQAMVNVNDVIGDEQMKAKLKQSLKELPELFQDTRKTLAGMMRMSELAEKNLHNIERFTKPLGERGEALVDNIDSSIRRLDELLAELTNLGEAMNDKEGSLGQFLHNPDLYQRLNRAATNFEMASRRLQPIVNNVRVFTDKIARDPGQLGVRGALRKKLPTK